MYKNIDKNLISDSLSNIVLSMIDNTETEDDYTAIQLLLNQTLEDFPEYNEKELSLLYFDFILSSFYSKKDQNPNLLGKVQQLLNKGVFSSSDFYYPFIEAVFNKTFISEDNKISLLSSIIQGMSDSGCIKYFYVDKLIKLLIYSGNFLSENKTLYSDMINLKTNFDESTKELVANFTQGFLYLI